VYVSVRETIRETEELGQYIEYVKQLCAATQVKNWTDCNHFLSLSKDKFQKIIGTEEMVHDLIGNNGHVRQRTGVGGISKILFGTLD
jgi:hypothetical protein